MDAKMGRRQKGIDVRANSEERDIAKVEKPGEAHDDVQAEGEEGVEANSRDDTHDVIVWREQRLGSENERHDKKRKRDDVLEGRIDEGDGEALGNAEDKPAEHCATDVA